MEVERSNVSMAAVLLIVVSLLVVAGEVRNVAAVGCTSYTGLQACLPAVEGENPPQPTDSCCVAIRNTDTTCLCSMVISYSTSMGVNVDAALLLPKKCNHAVPEGYTCDGYDVPSYVPANRKLTSMSGAPMGTLPQ